ncbi:hypothetical protein IFO70_20075 [Phormidium tenue FACHB-886]|nr:hypothetical protein [Phormidium tenue FACHB-886]
MKSILFGILSLLTVSVAIAPAAQSQVVQYQTGQTTPSEVVNLARNGYFQTEGIPSHNRLSSAVAFGQITAEDVVEAAVQQNRVSPDVMNDDDYLNAVEWKLNSFNTGD